MSFNSIVSDGNSHVTRSSANSDLGQPNVNECSSERRAES